MQAPLPIFFAHANGFPAETYRYFFECLQPHPVDAIPILGIPPYTIQQSWSPLVRQVTDHLQAQHKGPVVGLGHSLGAVVLLQTAALHPERFSHLILIDPPIFGRPKRYMLALIRFLGLSKKVIPIVKKALARRDHFDTQDEARTYWAGKRFFAPFHPNCFEDYVQHSLKKAPEGGLTLRIPARMEGDFFTRTPWKLGPNRVSIPAHYLLPTGPGILLPSEKKSLPKRFPDFHIHHLAGNHMFPLEKPHETAEYIKQLIR